MLCFYLEAKTLNDDTIDVRVVVVVVDFIVIFGGLCLGFTANGSVHINQLFPNWLLFY